MPDVVRHVPNDPKLFERLLTPEQRTSDLYQPTNYWSSRASASVTELRKCGLHDFPREPRLISIDVLPGGNYWGHCALRKGGTKQPVVSSIYSDALAPEYHCTFDEPANILLRPLDYRAWIFTHRAAEA
jgi:hypothetical protein